MSNYISCCLVWNVQKLLRYKKQNSDVSLWTTEVDHSIMLDREPFFFLHCCDAFNMTSLARLSAPWMTSSIPELTCRRSCSRTCCCFRTGKFQLIIQTIYTHIYRCTHTHANIKNPSMLVLHNQLHNQCWGFQGVALNHGCLWASTVNMEWLKGICSHLPLVNDSPYASESIYLSTTQAAPICTHVFSQSIAEPPRWLTHGRTLPEFGSRVRRIALGTISSRVRP